MLNDNELEVYSWIKDDNNDRFDGIYSINYDISSDDINDWTVARDADGLAKFDVVVTPDEINAAVRETNGGSFDPADHADPVSLGDTDIFIDDDGSKYLFYSFVSEEFGGNQGEGQISAIQLT